MRSSNKNWIWAILAGCILLVAAYMRYSADKEQERRAAADFEQMMTAVQSSSARIKELEENRDAAETEAVKRKYQELLEKERESFMKGYFRELMDKKK